MFEFLFKKTGHQQQHQVLFSSGLQQMLTRDVGKGRRLKKSTGRITDPAIDSDY